MKEIIKLDIKNKKLLFELEKDSRKTISKIAKLIETSKEVANYRLKQMIKSGFIRRFEAIIDYSLLGLDFYRLVIGLHNLSFEARKIIIKDLKKLKNIDFNIYLMSDWDLEINIWVKNSREFYDFYNNFMNKYAESIKDKEIYLITKVHIFTHSYLHQNRNYFTFGDNIKKTNFDEEDEEILKLLNENPRESIVNLAEKLKMPASSVNFKINKLKQKKIFYKSSPVLNKTLLGYNTFRVEMTLSNPSKRDEIIKYLSTKPNVFKAFELLGKKDIDFYIDFKTTFELDEFLEELRIKLPYVKEFEVINVVID